MATRYRALTGSACAESGAACLASEEAASDSLGALAIAGIDEEI
jgi:hypothetical protein